MAKSGQSRADANKAIRQAALREQLAAQGHVQHVVEIASKMRDLSQELDTLEVSRLKGAADLHLKLINKYLGDIKSNEVTGEDGGPLLNNLTVQFIGDD
jgi:hypothetical protein